MTTIEQLLKSLEKPLAELYQLWDRIGIGRAAQEERSSAVLMHLRSLLEDMAEEEQALEKQIQQRVADLAMEVSQLARQLHLPEIKLTPGLAVLQQEKELRGRAELLSKEKKERMMSLAKLTKEDQLLCDVLCMTPHYIPPGSTPSLEQLDELKKHIELLTSEKEKRFNVFVKHKKQIIDLILQMERSPQSAFEKSVVCAVDTEFVLSVDNMKLLESLNAELLSAKSKLEVKVGMLWSRLHILWDRLEVPKHVQKLFEDGKKGIKSSVIEAIQSELSCREAQKLANIQKFVDDMRLELEQWWNKCYFSTKQRNQFKKFSDRVYTEELLTEHENEVSVIKQYYECNKHILELVAKREVLFCKMIEFEKKANDPNRFFADRGGKLLLEEKERKKLMKELPKVEQNVKDEILLWEKEHGQTFLVNGLSFIKYIEKTWHDFEEAKLREKEERQQAKTKLLNEEIIFGSKPITPVKRRAQQAITPTKTPKFRKVNDSKMSGSSKIHQSTMASSYAKIPTCKVTKGKRLSSSNKIALGSRNRRRSNRLARKLLGDGGIGSNSPTILPQLYCFTVSPQ